MDARTVSLAAIFAEAAKGLRQRPCAESEVRVPGGARKFGKSQLYGGNYASLASIFLSTPRASPWTAARRIFSQETVDKGAVGMGARLGRV